jgi:serine/threonine protein phosphatase 1
VNGLAATAVLALFVAGEVTSGYRTRFDWRPVTLVLFTLTVWSAWIVLQALPGLPAALQHPLWSEFAGSLQGASGTISINPASTWTTAAQVVPIAFLAIVAMRLAHDRRRTLFLLKLIAATTVGVAAYGLVAHSVGISQPFFVSAPDNTFVTGTFVARNAAATYFVIGLAAAASLFLATIETRLRATGASRASVIQIADALRSGGVYLAACLILATALLNTGSRGGVISGAIALLVAALFWAASAPISRRAMAGILALVGALMIAAAVLSSNALVERLESGVDTQGRLLAYQDTIDMILARPLLGHGAGTFIDAFPLFHNQAPSIGIWNAAHNSYLQLAADLGIPVATIVLGCGLAILCYMTLRLLRRKEPAPATVAAVSAALAVGFHASVDFSVQFQAVGLTLVVLLGTGLGEGLVVEQRGEEGERNPADPPPRNPVDIGQRETILVHVPAAAHSVGRRPAPVTSAPATRLLSLRHGGHIGLSRTARAVVKSGQALTVRRVSTGTDDRTAEARDLLAFDSDLGAEQHVEGARGRLVLVQSDSAQANATGSDSAVGSTNPVAEPTYVFGDLHGRLDLLLLLKEAIDRDAASRSLTDFTVVGLGDYIDRGPDSRGVMNALARNIFERRTILLRGNHEQMILDFLEEPERNGAMWLRNGALETLRSYGVDVTRLLGSETPQFGAVREALVACLPVSHLVLLQRMPNSCENDRYFFAHAGARPARRLDQQTDEDLLWIRQGFADRDEPFEKVVVHGHTVVEKPYFGEYRVNLDTGAYFSNRLTCLMLEGDERRLIDV